MNKNTQTATEAENILQDIAIDIQNELLRQCRQCNCDDLQTDHLNENVLSVFNHNKQQYLERLSLYRQQSEKQSAESEAAQMLKNPLSFDQAKEQVERLNGVSLRQLTATRFAEWLSGLIISNYKSRGNWYIKGKGFEKSDKLFNEFIKEYPEFAASQPKQGEGEAVTQEIKDQLGGILAAFRNTHDLSFVGRCQALKAAGDEIIALFQNHENTESK